MNHARRDDETLPGRLVTREILPSPGPSRRYRLSRTGGSGWYRRPRLTVERAMTNNGSAIDPSSSPGAYTGRGHAIRTRTLHAQGPTGKAERFIQTQPARMGVRPVYSPPPRRTQSMPSPGYLDYNPQPDHPQSSRRATPAARTEKRVFFFFFLAATLKVRAVDDQGKGAAGSPCSCRVAGARHIKPRACRNCESRNVCWPPPVPKNV